MHVLPVKTTYNTNKNNDDSKQYLILLHFLSKYFIGQWYVNPLDLILAFTFYQQ